MLACNVAAAIGILSCGGDSTGPKAVPGDLTATLTTPNADDRAILITITSPGTISPGAAGADYVVFSKTLTGKTSVAVFGTLTTGPLVRFSVPDVGQAASYVVTVSDVADASNAPRSSLAGYSVTVSK